jgi:hypothetical protein
MANIFKYRVWCSTELRFVDVWNTEPPSNCPNNISHQIDPSKTEISDAVYENITKISPVLGFDGKPIIHSSPRPDGTMTYVTGRCDDFSDPKDYGSGKSMVITHFVGGGELMTTFGEEYRYEYLYADFNVIDNPTYIYDAIVSFQNTSNDLASAYIVPSISTIETATNTNFRTIPFLDNTDTLIVPAIYFGGPNTGNVNVLDYKLVQSTTNARGEKAPAFWNADWNSTLKVFENITPAPGNGNYNLFTKEAKLVRFVNDVTLVGTGSINIESKDVEKIGHGIRFKICLKIKSYTDHNCSLSVSMRMYRKYTIRQQF